MLAIHIQVTTYIFLEVFFIYKNLHIEPFNYTIRSVCFDFRSTNVGSSVIGTGRSEGSILPYFYRFRCHYLLITYLRLSETPLLILNANQKTQQSRDYLSTYGPFMSKKKLLLDRIYFAFLLLSEQFLLEPRICCKQREKFYFIFSDQFLSFSFQSGKGQVR